MFALFNFIITIVAIIMDNLLGIAMNSVGYGPLYGLHMVATIIPSLAVGVRRLHEVGKSGWMFFILLLLIFGAIWLLVLFCTDSQQDDNKWGQNPKNNNS